MAGECRSEHTCHYSQVLMSFEVRPPLHMPSFTHRFLAKGLGATMWFFIFYRAR